MHDRHDHRYERILLSEGIDAIGEHERTRRPRRDCLRDLGVVPCIDINLV